MFAYPRIKNTKNNFACLLCLAYTLLFFLLSSCALRDRKPLGSIPPIPTSTINNSYALESHVRQSASLKRFNPENIFLTGYHVDRVQNSVNKILRANDFQTNYKAIVIDDSNVNAATDGLIIYFYKGLLDKLYDEDYLDGIVAHELAHISCEHRKKQERDFKIRKGLIGAVGAIAGVAVGMAQYKNAPTLSPQTIEANVHTTTQIINTMGDLTFLRPYSREQEYEADEVGMMMAAKAGVNPKKVAEFWQKAPTILGDDGYNSLSSTHPAHIDRYKNLERAIQVANNFYNSDLNLDFEDMILRGPKIAKNKKETLKVENFSLKTKISHYKLLKEKELITEKEYRAKVKELLKTY